MEMKNKSDTLINQFTKLNVHLSDTFEQEKFSIKESNSDGKYIKVTKR
jgi:hypothetical protein